MRRADVVEATVRVLREAETSLPSWVQRLIEQALELETNRVARSQLQLILQNIHTAQSESLPMCQDTGLLVFYVKIGRDLNMDFALRDAIVEGVRRATLEVPLRPNVVDPLSRKNSGDNTGVMLPDLIVDEVDGDSLCITAFPKGAGSENMSLVGMLNPADDPSDFILKSVAKRAANACPPLFLGIGIGGTFDLAARQAKKALFNMPGDSELELDLLGRINSLGIGPMGLGGDTTALGVRIEKASCHTASLPVAINFQCWAHRCASTVVK
jgi:fumarate hydratase subunit alpha